MLATALMKLLLLSESLRIFADKFFFFPIDSVKSCWNTKVMKEYQEWGIGFLYQVVSFIFCWDVNFSNFLF